MVAAVFSCAAQYWAVSSIFHWARSDPSGSVLTNFWIHLSVSIVSNETLLFCSSSGSLLMCFHWSISASLRKFSLCFPCSMCGSGLSFQRECLLTVFLSNWSIAWFIIVWKSFMSSIWSALQLISDKLSSSSDSSWSLLWSWGDCFATSHGCILLVRLLDPLIISHLSVDRRHGICSHVFGGISTTTLSSVTVSVTFQTLCVSVSFPVGFPTALSHLLMQDIPPLHLVHNCQLCFCICIYTWSYSSYDITGMLL